MISETLFFILSTLAVLCNGNSDTDITDRVFGSLSDGLPAAFGDFNSDELTDIFVLRNNQRTLEIFLSAEEEPLLRSSQRLKCDLDADITSVVPGDFDGDALMDVLVTTRSNSGQSITIVHILWGGAHELNCSKDWYLEMIGQPLAIDYDQNMIIDLYGVEAVNHEWAFWVFDNTRRKPNVVKLSSTVSKPLKHPHGHAFLDLNNDNTADLFITTKHNFEIWNGVEGDPKFVYNRTIHLVPDAQVIGQPFFIDVELSGRLDLIVPVCADTDCRNSKLMVHYENHWHDLYVGFKDNNNHEWGFYRKDNILYADTITVRTGDFNMDGYPDLLATLITDSLQPQAFLLENVPCQIACKQFSRSYAVKWDALGPLRNGTVMAAFFDFYQNGILDVIFVQHNKTKYSSVAFKNSLDYDANFVKVMVLTGLTNNNTPMIMGRIGKKRKTYGTNLPGPKVSYNTTTQEGNMRHAVSAQLPQSAHFSLNLPYNIFGLGRTPNFVDSLTVGLSNRSRSWTQIIPNSQMVVIPWPPTEPAKWKAQLFVTPSQLILMSVMALTTVCGLITVIIGVLHWKERQEDKKERLSESHRFHFDAM